MTALLPLEEAQRRLIRLARQTNPVNVSLPLSGAKRFLARDVHALRTQPAADLSAMDGYALVGGVGPWSRVGESRAGTPFPRALNPGECVRISTGAHVPAGADRILIQENAAVDGATIQASELPRLGQHVRKKGFDFSQGDLILEQGAAVSPATVALAVAAGLTTLPVLAPPSVAILDSGDELALPGMISESHQIPASNGIMLKELLARYVGESELLGPVPDDLEVLGKALKRAEDFDILITSGGASVGDHDLLQQALKDWGADIAFWKVAIKPGKPLMIATRPRAKGHQVILGLPGNPVSSFVTAFLFALPLVRGSMGHRSPFPNAFPALSFNSLPETGSRREFLRGHWDGEYVKLVGSQDSSAIRTLVQANCLIERPGHSPHAEAGTQVPILSLQNG